MTYLSLLLCGNFSGDYWPNKPDAAMTYMALDSLNKTPPSLLWFWNNTLKITSLKLQKELLIQCGDEFVTLYSQSFPLKDHVKSAHNKG